MKIKPNNKSNNNNKNRKLMMKFKNMLKLKYNINLC